MVGYSFLLLWGWVEWVVVVRSGGMFGSQQVWGWAGMVGVEYGWGIILSS